MTDQMIKPDGQWNLVGSRWVRPIVRVTKTPIFGGKVTIEYREHDLYLGPWTSDARPIKATR